MEILNINHIHYVSKNFEKHRAIMGAVFGREEDFYHDYTPEGGCICSFWNFPHGFQIMQVTDKEKMWAKWLTEAEEGIHTVAMQVRSIDECIPEMEANGWPPMIETNAANGGVRELEFDTYDTFGFFIELMEYVTDFRE